jgi:hypothetical protein
MATRLNFSRFHGEIGTLRARTEQLRAALRARRADEAIRLADDLVAEARRIGSANTGVFRPEDDERKELEYLAVNGAVVRSALGIIDQNLRPIPSTSVRIYRTEIPQGLYASVMGANPSSSRREANPVESVTYAEAEAFAARFGWILWPPLKAGIKGREICNPAAVDWLTWTIDKHDFPMGPGLLLERGNQPRQQAIGIKSRYNDDNRRRRKSGRRSH